MHACVCVCVCTRVCACVLMCTWKERGREGQTDRQTDRQRRKQASECMCVRTCPCLRARMHMCATEQRADSDRPNPSTFHPHRIALHFFLSDEENKKSMPRNRIRCTRASGVDVDFHSKRLIGADIGDGNTFTVMSEIASSLGLQRQVQNSFHQYDT